MLFPPALTTTLPNPTTCRNCWPRVKTILRTQQLEKQLQRQSQQLAALNSVGVTVAASLEVSEVLAAAVDGVYEILAGGFVRSSDSGKWAAALPTFEPPRW